MPSMRERMSEAYDRFVSEEGRQRSLRVNEAMRNEQHNRNLNLTNAWHRPIVFDDMTETNMIDEHRRQLIAEMWGRMSGSEIRPTSVGIPDTKIETDLMALVNECATPTALVEGSKVKHALARAKRLEKLGFASAAQPVLTKALLAKKMDRIVAEKFIAIKGENIYKFLRRLADDYNKKNNCVEKTDDSFTKLIAYTGHYRAGVGIGRFEWCEVPVEKYDGIPPDNVLTRFEEVRDKKVFDTFTVATVKEVKDPLLLGHIEGCKDRFFIAQWGDDVKLDDVI